MATEGNDLLRQYYEMLMDSQFWPEAELVAYQRGQAEQLLRHARAQVPFYEHRLDAVFAGDGSIDWDKWRDIPIVQRSDLLEHREAMQAKVLPPGHGSTGVAQSSGSTGQSIEVTVNALVMLAARANGWRSNVWQSLDWSRTLVARRHKVPPLSEAPEGTRVGIWGPPWDAAAREGICVDVGPMTPLSEVAAFLSRHQPDYFMTGAKTIHALGLESERLGLPIQLKAALAHGERVAPDDTAACRHIFGAPLFSLYSSKEGGQIAHPCEHNLGMHVNAESLMLEILDDDGNPCPIGVPGRVIVTPFFSTAQPLIRYEQGDLAMFGMPCSCGRHLPVLADVLGRTSAIFRHPDGRAVHTFVPEEARAALRCGMWQIAQVGPLDFEVRYVPKDWGVLGDEAEAAAIFRSAYFDDARVSFQRLREVRTTAAGKYLEYVNET